MKKILAFLLIFCGFFAIFSQNQVHFADFEASCVITANVAFADFEKVYVVTANSAVAYSAPNPTSERLATLSHKDEVVLESVDGKVETYSYDGWNFFKFQFEKEQGEMVDGYILADLVSPKTSQIVAIPNFNAQTNATCNVFFKENLQIVESEITLSKGTRIFLYEGFDSKNEFTAIAFLDDNEVVYGYLKTSNVAPDGINPVIITCIVIILAVLGIIFAWLFMKNKKSKR